MRKIYVLLILCLLILSVFISCDDKNQGVELVTITLDSGILKEEAKTIETAENTSVILPSGDSLWSTSGYTFSGWAETATGIDKYKAGDKYSSSKSTTLYAVWTPNHKITYNPNGGTGEPITEYYKSGDKVTIKNTGFEKEGYTLSGWSTSQSDTDSAKVEYIIGQEIVLKNDLKLYAVWVENENKATITYSSNGGSGTINSVPFAKGTEVTLADDSLFSRGGYILDSWNTSSDGNGTIYQLSSTQTFNEDVTLYAIWTEKYNIKYYSYNEENKEYELIAIDYPQGTSTTIGNGNGLSKAGFVLYWTKTEDPDGNETEYNVGDVYKGDSVSLYAQWKEDPRLKYTLNGDTYSVRASSEDISGEIEIPDTYRGKEVTAIEDLAFEKCTGITKVTIPESVTSIGRGAFYTCTSLTSVNIPKEVTELKAYETEDYSAGLFEECSALKTIEIPSNVEKIGYGSFRNCIYLETINIPGNVTLIGNNAFDGCQKLTSVTLPEKVTEIGCRAFSKSGLTSIEIPSSVTKIGTDAFDGCTSLKAIYLNKEYKEITDKHGNRWGAPEKCTVTLKPTKVGDTMELGTYKTASENYEAITWKCIQYDSDNKRALMISEDVLETRAFDDESNVYANSDIRTYLNGDFIKTYGIDTSKMLSVDVTSTIEATDVGSGSDKLFLLSQTEANNLFTSNDNRVAKNLSNSESSWWLRSSDDKDPSAASCVGTTGDIWAKTISDKAGVRPAFWMSLE